MTEREALYAVVLAEPEADAPRLVYADWLEEHPRDEADTARAHFIRLEVEAEALPADSPDRAAMEAAAAKLFNRHSDAWNRDLPTWDEWYDSTLVYRRGFPEELRTVFRKLALSGGRLFTAAPIRSLCVTSPRGWPPSFNVLLQATDGRLPDLNRLRALTIGPRLRLGGNDEGVRRTFRIATTYPTLENLTSLSFAGNGIEDEAALSLVHALQDAVFRDSLEELDLSDNLIRAAGAINLSVNPLFSHLRRLTLTGNPLTADGRRMLRNHFGDRVVF